MTMISELAEHVDASSMGSIPLQSLNERLPELAQRFQGNHPVPHIFLPDFLVPEKAAALEREFPKPNSHEWTHYQHQNENKHGMTKRELFPPGLRATADELNSPAFVQWLSDLTGIPGLLADPSLEGGGLHQSGPGGYLNVHTDFSHHHYHKHWKRQINLILYLNDGWQEEWGGAIELWDPAMTSCVVKYPPRLNCALIFNTNEISYHGFPAPLTCPEGQSRKSLAFYYYTEEKTPTSTRSTDYRARPEDGVVKASMIWLEILRRFCKPGAGIVIEEEIMEITSSVTHARCTQMWLLHPVHLVNNQEAQGAWPALSAFVPSTCSEGSGSAVSSFP
jgi:Rps23 Pro-64 3,4-dihydroxylase Tpa1-like proline 4-hydroxylase